MYINQHKHKCKGVQGIVLGIPLYSKRKKKKKSLGYVHTVANGDITHVTDIIFIKAHGSFMYTFKREDS